MYGRPKGIHYVLVICSSTVMLNHINSSPFKIKEIIPINLTFQNSNNTMPTMSFVANLGGNNKHHNVVSVKTITFKNSVLEVCHRRGDAWAESVEARLLHVQDLPSADAIYHQECNVNFRTDKQIPTVHQISKACLKRAKMGHPQADERTDVFLEVASFLEENDDEQITINDLINRMEHNLANSEYEG